MWPVRKSLPWVAALSLSVGLAACGSSNSDSGGSSGSSTSKSSGGDTAAAKAVVEKAKAAPVWDGPTSSPKPAKGKFVISVPCSEAAIGCKRPSDGFLEAAKTMGWRTQLIDAAGDQQKVQAAMRQAITLHADAVFVAGFPVSAFANVIPELKKNKIKLATMGGTENKPHDPNGFDVVVNNDYTLDTPSVASYIAQDSNDKANVLLIDDSEFPQVHHGVQSMKEQLAKHCSGCKVSSTMDFSIADISTTFPSRVKAELQAHPEVNWVYAPYDFAGTFVANAIKQMGKVGKIKVAGIDGNPQNVQNIKDGVQGVTVARATEWVGWAAVDQVNRLFQGKPTLDGPDGFQSENYPRQLLDSSNLPADITAPWDGEIDFRSKYKALWGLGS